jgi:hypothetical protein
MLAEDQFHGMLTNSCEYVNKASTTSWHKLSSIFYEWILKAKSEIPNCNILRKNRHIGYPTGGRVFNRIPIVIWPQKGAKSTKTKFEPGHRFEIA